nr:MAG TPA: hypothetical protein [Caudoviricetes sp.]
MRRKPVRMRRSLRPTCCSTASAWLRIDSRSRRWRR